MVELAFSIHEIKSPNQIYIMAHSKIECYFVSKLLLHKTTESLFTIGERKASR